MTLRFGRETVIKFMYGELHVKDVGTSFLAMRSKIAGIRGRAHDLRVPFQAFRPVWQRQIRRVFNAEGLPVRWPALNPNYSAWKSRHFPGKPMMRRTDRLFSSLTGQTGDTIWVVTPRTIRMGTKVPYWKFGQRRRPTVVLLPEAFRQLSRMTMEHITGKGGRRG